MISVFSDYLRPYVEYGLMQDVEQKPSNIYEQLRIAYNQGSIGVKNTTRWFVPYYEQDSEEYDYDLLSNIEENEDLKKEIQWFNSKTIPELSTISTCTLHVRKVIMIRKLNKLVDEGKLDKDIAIRLFMNLVETVEREIEVKVNEDLPFLGCPIRLSLMTTAHNTAPSVTGVTP